MTSAAATFDAAGELRRAQERKPVNKWLVTDLDHVRHADGRDRRLHRQRRRPSPHRLARRHHRTDHLGHDRLRHRHGHGHAADRISGAPVRPEARLHGLPGCSSSSARRLCGMARTLPLLVIFRILQGLGAGALQPTEQAILRQTFPPKEQGMAMALFGMAVVLGPAFGPTLGGYIVDNYSWPWIFYINVPIGIISLLMVSRFVHEPEDVRAAMHQMAARQRKNMDWCGIALLFIGLGTMQYVLEEGNRNDWFAVGRDQDHRARRHRLARRAGHSRVERARARRSTSRSSRTSCSSSGTLIGAVMFAMLMAVTFLLPLFMQTLLGFSATQSGLALMPRSLTMLVVMPIVGRHLQQGLAAPRRRVRHRALRVHRVADGSLHAGDIAQRHRATC